MPIVYRGGPYAGQDDYLLPPPPRLSAFGGYGYYLRTKDMDADGRVVYTWVPETAENGRSDQPLSAW